MTAIRFIMLGGFLGAGKTTTISRLAREYTAQGLRVGIVTNDQAQNLVDTNLLRSQGLRVEEVPGACFCCRFDDLMTRIATLQENDRPEIILAEPVGSCTDLIATVIQPLKDLYGDRFRIAPYAVLFKPSHGLRILRNEPAGGFSPKAAYIFRKQLEEADAIVINRIDELPAEQLRELQALVAQQFPGVPIVNMSAKTGAGIAGLRELLAQDGSFGQRILDIDYDTYAEGEAELGWLNQSLRATAQTPFDLDELLMEVLIGIQAALISLGAEVAHLKLIGMDDGGGFAVANLVSNYGRAELSLASRLRITQADLIVNARAACDPDHLAKLMRTQLHEAAAAHGLTYEWRRQQAFRPGRPTPTHRYASR